MTNQQTIWFNWGASDAKFYPNDHPDQIFQEAWQYFLTEDVGADITFSQLVQLFPFYKKGVLFKTKFYN